MSVTSAKPSEPGFDSQVAPFFSIVVPTYRSESVIAPLLQSLAGQTERDFELVVSDGESPDATLAVIEAYRGRLPALRIDSRVDDGIYDAINHGIKLSRGRWVLILGADDQLADRDVLATLRPLLGAASEPFVYGDVRVVGPNAMVADGARYGGPFSMARILGQNICQQAIFYRRDIFERLGLFDSRYRLWADWHFAMRVFNELPNRWVDVVVALYAATGASSRVSDKKFQIDYWRNIWRLAIARPTNTALLYAILKHGYWNMHSKLRHR